MFDTEVRGAECIAPTPSAARPVRVSCSPTCPGHDAPCREIPYWAILNTQGTVVLGDLPGHTTASPAAGPDAPRRFDEFVDAVPWDRVRAATRVDDHDDPTTPHRLRVFARSSHCACAFDFSRFARPRPDRVLMEWRITRRDVEPEARESSRVGASAGASAGAGVASTTASTDVPSVGLAGAEHAIRTPLAQSRMIVDLLGDEGMDPRNDGLLRQASSSLAMALVRFEGLLLLWGGRAQHIVDNAEPDVGSVQTAIEDTLRGLGRTEDFRRPLRTRGLHELRAPWAVLCRLVQHVVGWSVESGVGRLDDVTIVPEALGHGRHWIYTSLRFRRPRASVVRRLAGALRRRDPLGSLDLAIAFRLLDPVQGGLGIRRHGDGSLEILLRMMATRRAAGYRTSLPEAAPLLCVGRDAETIALFDELARSVGRRRAALAVEDLAHPRFRGRIVLVDRGELRARGLEGPRLESIGADRRLLVVEPWNRDTTPSPRVRTEGVVHLERPLSSERLARHLGAAALDRGGQR